MKLNSFLKSAREFTKLRAIPLPMVVTLGHNMEVRYIITIIIAVISKVLEFHHRNCSMVSIRAVIIKLGAWTEFGKE